MLCAASSVQLTGETVNYTHERQGQTTAQYICGICHTWLLNETKAAPGMNVVRAGVLDGPKQFEPDAHIWTRHKQPCLVLPETIEQWEKSPTPKAFAAVINLPLTPYLSEISLSQRQIMRVGHVRYRTVAAASGRGRVVTFCQKG